MTALAKTKLETNIAEIAESGKGSFLWSPTYNLNKVVTKLVFRGYIGDEFWIDDLLEVFIAPYREHVRREGVSEEDIDKDLVSIAQRLNIDVNRLRRIFYSFELAKEKVEATNAEAKSEPVEREEIVLEGAEES